MKYVKVISSIIVALLGAFGSYMGYKANTQSKDSSIKIEAIVEQMNGMIIPRIQKGLDDINENLHDLAKIQADLRERIAKLEAYHRLASRTKASMSKVAQTFAPNASVRLPMLQSVRTPPKVIKQQSAHMKPVPAMRAPTP